MQIENLIYEDDAAQGYFENMCDHDAFIVVGVDEGDVVYGCAVNPDIDPGRELGALGWCAQLVTRIEDLGFDAAMKADAWQHRSDGRWPMATMGPGSGPGTTRLTRHPCVSGSVEANGSYQVRPTQGEIRIDS